MDDKNWHSKKIDNLLVDFDTPVTGLSTDEANARLDKYGQNKLKEPEKTSAFIRFISQYNDPLNYLLIGAAILALAIHPDKPGDSIFIALVLTANAFLGSGKKTKQNKKWVRSRK